MRRRSGAFDLGGRTARGLRRALPSRVFRVVAQAARTVDVAVLTDDRSISDLASAGVCLVGGSVPATVPALLAEVICSGPVGIPLDRERQSVSIRRAAVETSQVPSITVVMATKRPWAIETALDLVDRQVGVDVQVALGLHGDDWSAWSDSRLEELTRWPLAIARLPESASLGQVLDATSALAMSEIITKWDDDDWYGRHHLADVFDALEFSGATIVGKAAEFVYLEASDTTVRRDVDGGSRFSSTIAGGTLTISRDDLAVAGGWPDVRRHVDVGLIRAVHRSGGTSYRTHGLDYVLIRRTPEIADHTWSADYRYFLDAAAEQWPGRRIDLAAADHQ